MIIPDPNLPVGSLPWADAVEAEESNTVDAINSIESNQLAFLKEQDSSLQLLSEQIADLNAQVVKVPFIQSVGFDLLGPGFPGDNAWHTLHETTVPVPAGKTVADVMAFGLIRSHNPGAAGVYIYFRVGINSNFGPATPADFDFMANVANSVTLVNPTSITITGQGLATGGSFVDTRVSLSALIAFK